jgi:hypothetical protein
MNPRKRERSAGTDELHAHAANVILSVPAFSGGERDACHDLLSGGSHGSEKVLAITYRSSAEQWLNAWDERSGGETPTLVIAMTGDRGAPTAANLERAVQSDEHSLLVNRPDDLTGIGIKTSECLLEWDRRGERAHVCFDSLTALLQYVDLRTAFKFLNVFTTRAKQLNASAHFHLDPSAHDRQTVHTLLQVADAVVELDDDGNASVVAR